MTFRWYPLGKNEEYCSAPEGIARIRLIDSKRGIASCSFMWRTADSTGRDRPKFQGPPDEHGTYPGYWWGFLAPWPFIKERFASEYRRIYGLHPDPH